MLKFTRRFGLCLGLVALLAVCPAVQAQDDAAGDAAAAGLDQQWEDYAHYVQVRQVPLANALGQKLLEADAGQLLDIVESSRHARNLDTIWGIATRTAELKEAANKLIAHLETAKLQRARQAQRIIDDLERLSKGERHYQNAIRRLREAGQWVAPHLLNALTDEQKKSQANSLLRATRDIGLPLVYPFASAINELEPVTQVQLAQVLQEIGYARALPYILQAIENPKTDAHAREQMQSAFDKLAQRHRIPADANAAQLFLVLGENLYTRATDDPRKIPGYDVLEMKGVVWRYSRTAGLVPVRVPAPIFGDVLAMDAARDALKLDNDLDAALSLWLAANLRRENRLPEGEADLTYPANKWHPPAFYAQTAGALRLHDVLDRALNSNDPALALDAIQALGNIAGTEVLVNREGTIQPLLAALSYPDRRVRFNAGFVLTNAKPQDTFPGAQRVVPVLAEAVRQSEVKSAVVVAREDAGGGKLHSVLETELQFGVSRGDSLGALADRINASAGADLLIIRADLDELAKVLNQASTDYKLASVPVIAVLPPNRLNAARVRFARRIEANRLFPVEAADDTITKELLEPMIQQATAAYVGAAIEADEAEQLALRALALLREVALARGDKVFRVTDAQAALVDALKDPRESVAKASGAVLSLLDNQAAQQAIATAALDDTRSETLRIALLGSLAESATYYGNQMDVTQTDRLLALVKEATGPLAVAASRAHGAMTLPTSNAVQLIVKD